MKISKDMIETAWSRYEEYKERAEQHEFPELLFLDSKLVPMYNDLTANWNEAHAEIFYKWMLVIGKRFGIDMP